MIRTICCLIFLLTYIAGLSQTQIDSLKNLLVDAKGKPKVSLLIEIADSFTSGREYSDSTQYYASIARDMALELNDEHGYFEAQIILGNNLNQNNEPDSALLIYNSIFSKVLEYNDSTLLARFYTSLASPYERLEKMDEATRYTLKAITLYEQLDDPKKLSKVYYNMSILYSRSEDFERSLEYRLKAWKLSMKEPAAVRSRLASSLAGVYGELYLIHEEASLLDSAIYYANTGLLIAKSEGIKSLELSNLGKLIAVYYVKKEYKKGLSSSYSMISQSKSINNDRWLCQGYYKAADFLMELNQIGKASLYADSALVLAKKMNWAFYITASYQRIYESNKNLGDYQKALLAHEQFKIFNDSLTNSEKAQIINQLEIKYDTEKKSREIERLNDQAKIQELKIEQRNTLIIVAISIFIILILILLLFFRQRNLKKQNELLGLEQRFLRTQMNPHFIFNALGAIQKFVIKSDPMQGATFIAKFSALMRKVLEHSREEFITIEEEIETLKNYLDLQKLRFEDQFDYEIQVSDNMDITAIKIPPMFAQPFIENALEHGIAKKQGGGKIVVSFEEAVNDVRLTIKDNGNGLDENDNRTDHKSLATKITHERLQMLSTKLGKTDLSIKNLKDDIGKITGVEVSLLLPTS